MRAPWAWIAYAVFTTFAVAFGVVEVTETFDPKAFEATGIAPPWLRPPFLMWVAMQLHLVELHMPRGFIGEASAAVVGAAWIGWTGAIVVKSTIGFPKRERIRLLTPMSIAVAPIHLGKARNVWGDHGINLEISFCSTGKTALEALARDECHVAVAGDYAISRFLKSLDLEWSNDPYYYVLPFAHLINQIKLMAPPPKSQSGDTSSRSSLGIVTLDQLQNKRIAFFKDSIHEEFITKINLKCQCSLEGEAQTTTSPLLGFLTQTSRGLAKACVMVEPYFIALENASYTIIDPKVNIDWYMCVVMKAETIKEYPQLRKRFPRALRSACRDATSDRDEAMRSIVKYVLEEFTGIDEAVLKERFKARDIDFSIPSQAGFWATRAKALDFREDSLLH